MSRFRIACCAWSLLLAGRLLAQGPDRWDPRQVHLARVELKDLMSQLQLAGRSPAYSSLLRARALGDAELAAARLRDGDFQVGDRILLQVESDSTLTDTFTIAPGRVVMLPRLGSVPLAGVLRSELDSTFAHFVGQFLREPRVRAQALIRVAIDGAVVRPGFYTVTSEELLSNALMLAGGPNDRGNVAAMRVERGTNSFWEGAALRDAMSQGRTLDQMDIRSGDHVRVPLRRSGLGGAEGALRTISLILTIPLTILAVTRVF